MCSDRHRDPNTTRFFLNTVLLPASLLSLVAGTWAMDRKKPDGEDERASGAEEYDEAKANKRSDFYFAFFLSCALPCHHSLPSDKLVG
eukprot:COSAG04_NODE_110_length_25928_cov_18.966782_31_plen_88_part_00